MAAEYTFLIRSNLFDRDRTLTIHPEYLSFDDSDLVSAGPTTFEKANIESFRFGVAWIKGLYFPIGRIYRIGVRGHDGKVIKITLRSLYGIHKKKLITRYQKICKALHDNYLNELGLHYVNLVNDNLAFRLAEVTITPEGIEDPKIGMLGWDSVGLRAYATYFALHDKSDSKKYHLFDYGSDWNAVLLYSVLTYITTHQSSYSIPGK